MAAGDKRKATKAIQSLLSIQFPNLVVDGTWGPRSQAALNRASGEVKQVAQSVKEFSESLVEVKNVSAPGVWVTRAEAERLIENAAKVASIPESWLLFMLELEPEKRHGQRGMEYRADSVSPGKAYFGLMQVGAPAWADARQRFPFIGSFEQNKFDPALNIVAAAGYAQANVSYARSIHKYQGEFTPELIYAMHNQGHTFVSSAKNGGRGRYFDGQSSKAKQVLTLAAVELRNDMNIA